MKSFIIFYLPCPASVLDQTYWENVVTSFRERSIIKRCIYNLEEVSILTSRTTLSHLSAVYVGVGNLSNVQFLTIEVSRSLHFSGKVIDGLTNCATFTVAGITSRVMFVEFPETSK